MQPREEGVDEAPETLPRDRSSAVALSYADKGQAPVVVAKGYGAVADAIIQRARDSGLYVHNSPDLVKLLMNVKLDAQIPPALYQAIAEVLAWLYQIDHRTGEKSGVK